MRVITSNGHFFIDTEDYIFISQHTWHITSHGYVANSKKEYLHRLLTNCPEGMVVDHIDGDRLNNYKSNLRICTHKNNIRNSRKNIEKTSLFKGVSLVKGVYISSIDNTYLGRFEKEEDAALAYNRKAIELFGEFANLNNVIDDGRKLKTVLETKKTSKYHGCSFDSKNNKFVAQVIHDGKNKKIGRFKEEIDAAEAFDNYVIKHGINRKLNFPKINS